MTIDIPARVQLLAQQPLFDLREEWRRLHRSPPPMRLSRDLLIRGIAYKMQERAIGGPSKALLRKLGASNAQGEDESDRRRTHPRQDRRLQTQGHVDGRQRPAGLRRTRPDARHQRR